MKGLLRRPGHATVAAYLALFLALGGVAFAAATIDSGDVIDGSLKSADLKDNKGVKGADVRNGSLRGRDVRGLRGANVAGDSITGARTDEGSLAVSQRVAQLGAPTGFALPTPIPLPFPNNTYTQAAEESNVLIGGGQVTFSAACIQPRSAVIYLLQDGATLTAENVVGFTQVVDSSAGVVSRRFTFNSLPGGAVRSLSQIRTGTATPHSFAVYGALSCNSGTGATLDSVGIDVVAER